MDFQIINFESFVAQFMGNNAEPFIYNQNQIQVYPLNLASKFIKALIIGNTCVWHVKQPTFENLFIVRGR